MNFCLCLLLLQGDLEEETNSLVSSSEVNNSDVIKLVDVPSPQSLQDCIVSYQAS